MGPSKGSLLTSDVQERLDIARLKLELLEETEPEYKIKEDSLVFEIDTLEKEVALRATGRLGGETHGIEQGYSGGQRQVVKPRITFNLPFHSGEGRPHSSDAAFLHPTDLAAYADNNRNGLDCRFASDDILMGQEHKSPMPGSWNFDSVDTGAMSRSGSSPESDFIRPRKRQKPTLALTEQPLGSFQASPSPVLTSNTTPTSYGSWDVPEDMFAFLGGNPRESIREMRAEQLEQEKLADERKRIMLRDEELARSLQELDSPSWPATTQFSGMPRTPRTPNTSIRPYAQSVLDSQGRFKLASPFASPYASPGASPKIELPSASSACIKQEDSFLPMHSLLAYAPKDESQAMHRASIKTERPDQYTVANTRPQSFTGTGTMAQPNFINLASDSDSASNSPNIWNNGDFIDLDADDWRNESGSGNVSLPVPGPSTSYTFPPGISHAATGLASQLGQTFYDAATGLFDHGQNLIGNGCSYGFGNSNSVYAAPVIDLSGDDGAGVSYDLTNQNPYLQHDLATTDPDKYQQYQDRIEYLSNDPTRTRAEIQSLLENIRPDEDLPPQNREGTPEAMTYPLMEHQKLGLAWLKKMEESEQKGGILADDMGLGKTIQALALMVSRRSEDPLCKTTLIVAPVALMKQWEKEIETKLKPNLEHRLKTFILHGNNRQRNWDYLRTYDVVLTTFGTLSSEFKRKEAIDMKKRANPNWRPTSKEDALPTLGNECKWYRVIIDEAQCIKNKSTKAALAAFCLRAKSRFCMTGTPMMNNIEELGSLIRFLKISPYHDSKKFSAHFSRPLKGQSPTAKTQAMRKLQVLLRAILLRRTKKSMIDGKPILQLPPRTTESEHAVFSEDESQFYQALEGRTQLQFNKYLKADTVGRNYSNILVLLLRLRQACCHPHLIKNFAQEGLSGDVSTEDMMKLARELAPDVVDRIKELSGSNEDGALECPVCMDMTENATIFIPCGHSTCSECFARITDPSQAIASGDVAETRNGESRCPHCRGKISAKQIIDHATFKKIHQSSSFVIDPAEEDFETSDDNASETDDDSDDVDVKGNLKGFVVDDDEINEGVSDEEHKSGYRPGETPFEKASHGKPKKSKGKGKAKADMQPRKTLGELKKESLRNQKAKRRYLKRLEKEWVTSAKIEKTMELIREVQKSKNEETKQPEKIIIFSQFTSLLDLLEVPICRERLEYSRYDGSMNADQRNDAVVDFTENKNARIMLISLKAGNSGLNLTAASQVIIFDPFWNPYIEEQAIDRAHRIGQRVPVQVHRILVPETVEDRILALQEKKRALIESALDEGAARSIGRLGTKDLAFLFDVPISQ